MCRQQQMLRNFGSALLLTVVSLLAASVVFLLKSQDSPMGSYFDNHRFLSSSTQYTESGAADMIASVKADKQVTTPVEAKLEPAPLFSSVNSLPRGVSTEAKVAAGKGGNADIDYYHIFHNVKIEKFVNSGLALVYFYTADNPPPKKRIQKSWFLSEFDEHLSITVHYQELQLNDTAALRCKDSWVIKPAILFHISFANNIFHMFNEGILGIYQTLRDAKLLPQHILRLLEGTSTKTSEKSAEQCAMSGTTEEVALIAMRPHVYHQPWSFMLKDISTDQSILSEMEGVCFSTLIIGGSDIANMYHGTEDETWPNSWLEARRIALNAFQPFALLSALKHKLKRMHPSTHKNDDMLLDLCQSLLSPQKSGNGTVGLPSGNWKSGTTIPRVTLASRRVPGGRALINEDQIMAYIASRWDVEVVSTNFDGELFDSMDLMRHTDVFLGMHGAGWTNTLFLSEGSAALQLFPYGWDIKDGPQKNWVVREGLYKKMVLGRNASYFSWVNQDPADAFFSRKYFSDTDLSKYNLHPNDVLAVDRPKDQMPGNHWIYQSTIAQLRNLILTLEAVFKEAGIAEKESWAITSAIVLARLEAETEAVRQEYILSSAQVSPVAVAS